MTAWIGGTAAVLALAAPGPLTAQERPAVPVVTGIVIERGNVFDSASTKHQYARLLNSLHVTTRAGVVRSEILLPPGEPFRPELAAETARNLRGLGVFRQVRIDTVPADSGVVLRVRTRDGWSLAPDVVLASGPSSSQYTLSLSESNLLGTAAALTVIRREVPERSSTTFSFLRRRLFANRITVALAYSDHSDGATYSGRVEYPFVSLSSRFGALLKADVRTARLLRFREGNRQPSDSLQHRYALVVAEANWAPRAGPGGYLRLGVTGQILRSDLVPDGSGFTFASTITAAVGPQAKWNRARFLTVTGLRTFERVEDVDAGTTLSLAVLAAPAALGYAKSGIGLKAGAHQGVGSRKAFAIAELTATGLFQAGALDSGTVTAGVTGVLKPGSRHLVTLRVEGGLQKDPLPGSEFDLGLDAAPRAYGVHAFTGDRMVTGTLEYRWTAAERLWGILGLGLAGFVDYGAAWYRASDTRGGGDAGLGLRVGLTPTTRETIYRFDLARRFATDLLGSGWVFSVGPGIALPALH